MARKRKLDPGVSVYLDRHGKERARFRLKGMSCALPHPSSPDYKEAYANASKGLAPRKSRVKPRTVADLFERFYRSNQFQRSGKAWQAIVRQTLKQFHEEAGHVPVADFNYTHIETMLRRRAEKQVVAGKRNGGPQAAARLREQLTRLFAFAIDRLQWIQHNPAKAADMPVALPSGGYHSWTEAEIAKYQAFHPVGSKARLALEIALWTGLRRADVAQIGPAHLVHGRVITKAMKTDKPVNIMAAPDLVQAIEATQTGADTLLVTAHGKPYTANGLGNWFRDQCNAAGLRGCTIHGLRKAFTRRAADLGASQQQLKALGQWEGDDEVRTYTAAADQIRLADAAIQNVIASRTTSNPPAKVRQNTDVSRGEIA